MLPINGAETEIKQSQLSTMAVEMSYNSSNPPGTVVHRGMKSPSSHPKLHIPSTVKTFKRRGHDNVIVIVLVLV